MAQVLSDVQDRRDVYLWAKHRRKLLYFGPIGGAPPIPLEAMERLAVPLDMARMQAKLQRLASIQQRAVRAARRRSDIAIAIGRTGRPVLALILKRLDVLHISADVMRVVTECDDDCESLQLSLGGIYHLLATEFRSLLVGTADELQRQIAAWDTLAKLRMSGLYRSSAALRKLAKAAAAAEADLLGQI